MPARFAVVDHDTPLLMPPDLREWVPEDHLVHFIMDAVSPSSALKKQPLLICSGLSNKSAIFLHYILHHFRSAWEAQAQVREQHGDVLIGLCHRP